MLLANLTILLGELAISTRQGRRALFICLCCSAFLTQVGGATIAGYVVEWGYDTASGKLIEPRVLVTNAVSVSAAEYHNLALLNGGRVVGWGFNESGCVLGEESTNSNLTNAVVKVGGRIVREAVAIAASRDFSLALMKNGTVVAWGKDYVPDNLPRLSGIATGRGFNWGLRPDGRVVGWPSLKLGKQPESAFIDSGLSNVLSISVGPGAGSRRVALLADGTVQIWGNQSTRGDEEPPIGLKDVVSVSAGASHSLALKKDGTVVGWGYNHFGAATGVPAETEPHIAKGTVSLNGSILSGVKSIAAGEGFSLALKDDGTVVAWGKMVNDLYPVSVPKGLNGVTAISAGQSRCLAITTNFSSLFK